MADSSIRHGEQASSTAFYTTTSAIFVTLFLTMPHFVIATKGPRPLGQPIVELLMIPFVAGGGLGLFELATQTSSGDAEVFVGANLAAAVLFVVRLGISRAERDAAT